jgi:hypothetical protein
VLGPAPAYGLAQLGDRVQEVVGADVVADHTLGRGGVEQRGESGAEPLQKVAGQPGERRVARVQCRGETALGAEQLGEPVDPARERLCRLERGSQHRARLGNGVDAGLHHGLHQVRALREVPVQRADPDTGQVGDLLRGRVHAGRVEDGPRGLQQRVDVALRVGAAPSRRLRRIRGHGSTSACVTLPMTHLATAFTIAHPGVTWTLLGARTGAHLDDLLAGLDVTLSDDVLDRIDEIVPPGTDVGALDQAYQPQALEDVSLRRRPLAARAAA